MIMPGKRFIAVAICVLLAFGVSFTVAEYARHPHADSPSIKAERQIDLGLVQHGVSIEKQIQISNTGGKSLEVSKVTTSCGCLALLKTDGDASSPSKLDSFSVLPYSTRELLVQFNPRANNTGKSTKKITLITNDPSNEVFDITLSAAIWRGVSASPSEIYLGRLSGGSPIRTSLEIVDDRLWAEDEGDLHFESSVPWLKILASYPKRVRLRAPGRGDKYIVEIGGTVPAGHDQEVAGTIDVLNNRKMRLETVLVRGVYRPDLRVTPSEIDFKASDSLLLQGKVPVRCICRCDSEPIQAQVLSCPKGVKASIGPPILPNQAVIEVSLVNSSDKLGQIQSAIILKIIRQNTGRNETISLPVSLR
jgi:hypothetical protein